MNIQSEWLKQGKNKITETNVMKAGAWWDNENPADTYVSGINYSCDALPCAPNWYIKDEIMHADPGRIYIDIDFLSFKQKNGLRQMLDNFVHG